MSEQKTQQHVETAQEDRAYTIDLSRIKVKTLRAFEAAQRRGLTLDDMAVLLPEMIDGLTTEDIDDMTMPELQDMMQAVKTSMGGAIPKANGTPSLSRFKGTTALRPPRGRKR